MLALGKSKGLPLKNIDKWFTFTEKWQSLKWNGVS